MCMYLKCLIGHNKLFHRVINHWVAFISTTLAAVWTKTIQIQMLEAEGAWKMDKNDLTFPTAEADSSEELVAQHGLPVPHGQLQAHPPQLLQGQPAVHKRVIVVGIQAPLHHWSLPLRALWFAWMQVTAKSRDNRGQPVCTHTDTAEECTKEREREGIKSNPFTKVSDNPEAFMAIKLFASLIRTCSSPPSPGTDFFAEWKQGNRLDTARNTARGSSASHLWFSLLSSFGEWRTSRRSQALLCTGWRSTWRKRKPVKKKKSCRQCNRHLLRRNKMQIIKSNLWPFSSSTVLFFCLLVRLCTLGIRAMRSINRESRFRESRGISTSPRKVFRFKRPWCHTDISKERVISWE